MTELCNLTQKSCTPCEGGIQPLSQKEATTALPQIPGWQLSEDSLSISRRFEFKNFMENIAFINAMAWVAHTEDHHPDFSAGYKHCEVSYTTHAIGGLSENDFICAAKINGLL